MCDLHPKLFGEGSGDTSDSLTSAVRRSTLELDSVRTSYHVSLTRHSQILLQDITSPTFNRSQLPQIPHLSRESLFSYHTANDTAPTNLSADLSRSPSAFNLPLQPKPQHFDFSPANLSHGFSTDDFPQTPPASSLQPLSQSPAYFMPSDVIHHSNDPAFVETTPKTPMESMLAALEVLNTTPENLSLSICIPPEEIRSERPPSSFYDDPEPHVFPQRVRSLIGSFSSLSPTPKAFGRAVDLNIQPRATFYEDREDFPARQNHSKREFGCWGRLLLILGVKGP